MQTKQIEILMELTLNYFFEMVITSHRQSPRNGDKRSVNDVLRSESKANCKTYETSHRVIRTKLLTDTTRNISASRKTTFEKEIHTCSVST